MKLILSMLIGLMAWSSAQADVYEISPNHKVYYRYSKAKGNNPTVVLLNGLIYKISHWDEYYDMLVDQGMGVVQVAYSTQPESLAYLDESPYFSEPKLTIFGPKQEGIETQTLIDEVMDVVDLVGVDRFDLLTLSYGSIVGSEMAVQYKSRIDNLIFVSPAVQSSHLYNAYGQGRHTYYTLISAAGNPGGANYWYDQELKGTLSLLVTPAKYAFEDVSFYDFFNGVYQMARSAKWFDLKDYAEADLPPTYLFLASLEDDALYQDQHKFWKLMENNPAQRGLVIFEGGYHALPGVVPEAAATQTLKVLREELTSQLSVIKVGTGNPVGTLTNSLLDFSDVYKSKKD